jgi:hypothetical protein
MRDCIANCGRWPLTRERARARKRARTRNRGVFGYVYTHEHVQVHGRHTLPLIVPLDAGTVLT